MHEGPEIPNQRRAVHEQLERHRGVLAIILLDKVPYDEAHGSDDERREDVRGVPCELLAAPDEAHDKDSKGGGGHWSVRGLINGDRWRGGRT
jgi:hypothetical protein